MVKGLKRLIVATLVASMALSPISTAGAGANVRAEGVEESKYEKNGTLVDTEDIQWGTSGLSASYHGSTWTYTIPASDEGHGYKYVITYETEVDSDTFLTTTVVSNTVENEYDSDVCFQTLCETLIIFNGSDDRIVFDLFDKFFSLHFSSMGHARIDFFA